MPDLASGGAIAGIAGGLGSAASGIAGIFGGGGGDSGGSDALIQAANIQSASSRQSAQEAIALQREMYDYYKKLYGEYVERISPWTKAGTTSVNEYAGLLNLPGYTPVDRTEYLRSTPGYQFQIDQGINALDRSAASKGMLLSGPQAKAVTKYGQGLADTTYNSLMDRIYNLSGQGLGAATSTGSMASALGSAGMSMANNAGNALMSSGQYQGNAQAQGLINAYNARQSAYNNDQNNLYGGLGALASGMGQVGKGAQSLYNAYSGNSGLPSYSYGGTTEAGYPYYNATYGGGY